MRIALAGAGAFGEKHLDGLVIFSGWYGVTPIAASGRPLNPPALKPCDTGP